MGDDLQRKELLKKLHEQFRGAEYAIKAVELRIDNLVIPAINELRYAGKHLLSGLKDDPSDGGYEKNLEKAVHHCQRARYDAAEAGVVYCLTEARTFETDYRKVSIGSVVPDYVAIRTKFREAQELIRDSSGKETRSQHADECLRIFEELGPLIESLDDARPELNKLTHDKRAGFAQWIVIVVLTIATVVLGVLALK